MNFNQALQYLFEQLPMFHRIGAAAYKADLSTTLAISEILGKPEIRYRTIHIAGTNGKGSTSHFLSSILQEAGYRTGLFTSPHLKDFRERIRVNGTMISRKDVCEFVEGYRSAVSGLRPSFFEWTFGLASHYFAEQKVDVAVMETGMGGRLDSTNIIRPDLSVITNIGWDHTQFLGETLEAIAREKAGIIKRNVPVVIGEAGEKIKEVFLHQAEELKAPIFFANEIYSIDSSAIRMKGQPLLRVDVRDSNGVKRYFSSLTGSYQLKNILTVLQAVAVLQKSGYTITATHIEKGLKHVLRNTHLRGRWDILAQNPLIIADISHNSDGMKELSFQLQHTTFSNLHFVLGMVKDKDIDAVLPVLPVSATYYFCKAQIPRGMDAKELQGLAGYYGLQGKCYSSVAEAFESAKASAGNDDLILVSGSAFVVAEIL